MLSQTQTSKYSQRNTRSCGISTYTRVLTLLLCTFVAMWLYVAARMTLRLRAHRIDVDGDVDGSVATTKEMTAKEVTTIKPQHPQTSLHDASEAQATTTTAQQRTAIKLQLPLAARAPPASAPVPATPMPSPAQLAAFPPPCYRTHAFYYAWYGDARGAFDNQRYYHWDHPLLKHWNADVRARFSENRHGPRQRRRHHPPHDVGSNFFPALGTYSSRDPDVIHAHARQLRRARIGVISVSWYPAGMADDNGAPLPQPDFIVMLMDIMHAYSIRVCFHIEPYKGRTAATVADDIRTLRRWYGSHPAQYRWPSSSLTPSSPSTLPSLPLIYVYDSYQISVADWRTVLTPAESFAPGSRSPTSSIRNTVDDAVVIGLVVERRHVTELARAGFDGAYSYFAAPHFSYGADARNWKALATAFARTRSHAHGDEIGTDISANSHMFFIPSVGPGYIDTRIRPWNAVNTQAREGGLYFRERWAAAVAALRAAAASALTSRNMIIAVTSFNEWGEGTQIEAAVPARDDGTRNTREETEEEHAAYEYLDYRDCDIRSGDDDERAAMAYLDLTAELVNTLPEATHPAL